MCNCEEHHSRDIEVRICLLASFSHMVELLNLRSSYSIMVNQIDGSFVYYFLAFGSCIRGYAHMRKTPQDTERLAALARAQLNQQNDGQPVRHPNLDDDDLGDDDLLDPVNLKCVEYVLNRTRYPKILSDGQYGGRPLLRWTTTLAVNVIQNLALKDHQRQPKWWTTSFVTDNHFGRQC
ncbi:hypothetical protein FXO38_34330 [Capsicum annuum]|nr:hypothetical protein FXO38_34330 [Capsicum annuum]